MAEASTNELIKSAELAIAGAVVMIGLGLSGIFLSFATHVDPSTLFGWIFVASGFAYLTYAFATRNDGEIVWRMLAGFIYLFAGLYVLVFVSGLQLQHITFLAGSIVLAEGFIEFFVFSRLRPEGGSGWIAAGAIATIVLAIITWCLWQLGSMRLVGGIIGMKFVISGWSRLMYSIATRTRLIAAD